LDDAFQHLRLARDVDLVLLDSCKPLANGHLLPRGPLREPPSALARSSALILTRSADAMQAPSSSALQSAAAGCPIFQTRFVSYVARFVSSRPENETLPAPDIGFLNDLPVYAFSGLARNDRFQQSLEGLGCRIHGCAAFADHHPYSDAELTAIVEAARAAGGRYLITTEKDWARIVHKMPLPMDLLVLGIRPDFGSEIDALTQFIKDRLAADENG
jgi:tetraacyldisaccharide 4'-kinase